MTIPALAVTGASLRLGSFALRPLDLRLEPGEILVILGRNGAGKSVTLELIAGFHPPAAGRVLINGRDVTELPPERRRVGFVVQNFGLFPHLTVAKNVAFGAAADGIARPSSAGFTDLLDQFGIASLAHRFPYDLSPGEQQRTALARALATRPELFLFDEPFSALDGRSRERLRDELKRFLRRSGLPAIFVTHDRTDAFVLADRLAVIEAGSIVQNGPVGEVYRRPATPGIADLLGFDNILSGRVVHRSNQSLQIAVGASCIAAPAACLAGSGLGAAIVCIRGEDVALCPADAEARGAAMVTTRLAGHVIAVTNLGPFAKVSLDCGFPLTAYVANREASSLCIAVGKRVTAAVEPAAVHVLPAPDSSEALPNQLIGAPGTS